MVTCMEIFLLFGKKSSSHDFCIRPSHMVVLRLLAVGIWNQISESASLLLLGEHEDSRETLPFTSVCSEQLITKPHVSQVHPFLAVILKKRFLLVQKHSFFYRKFFWSITKSLNNSILKIEQNTKSFFFIFLFFKCEIFPQGTAFPFSVQYYCCPTCLYLLNYFSPRCDTFSFKV